MCGRFILLTDLSAIVESFQIGEVAAEYKTGNNISPGQQITAVIRDSNINKLVNYRWGLIPHWAKDPSIGYKMINARAETISDKPSFRDAFKKRRCLIIADGFYEWQKLGPTKKPLKFSLKTGHPFGLAGLYETWISPEQQPVNTCTIITTVPNDIVRPIHDRMPVMVRKEFEDAWMDPNTSYHKDLLSMLTPYPAEDMEVTEATALRHN